MHADKEIKGAALSNTKAAYDVLNYLKTERDMIGR